MTATKTDPAAVNQPFTISRVFDAPRDLLWQVFTQAEHMQQWWGPKGFKVFHATLDLRPGGTYHYGMTAPNGDKMWGKFVFREVKPRERIVAVSSFSDPQGGTTRHPLHQSWPLELFAVFTFEDQPGGKSKFTVSWQAHNASAEEQTTFDTNHKSMQMGWTGTLDQLTAYLAKAKG